MNFLELAKKRYSVRKYKDKAVEKEKLDKILEAARIAPTARNLQTIKLLVLQDKKNLRLVKKAANFYDAPLVIIACADHLKAHKRAFDGKETTDIDASILTTHMMLEATELGLGSVWICQFRKDIIQEEFNMPDSLEPINILAIGYSDQEDNDHLSKRKSIDEIVSYEKL